MQDAPTLKALVRPRFRGTLLGVAVGNALGFPFEGSTHSFMAALGPDAMRAFEAHRSGYFPPGQFSDDTQLTLATCEAILGEERFDGKSIAESFLPLWRENRIIGRTPGVSEAVERLIAGKADWRTSGCEEGRAGNGAAKRITPIGLWNYDEPEKLADEAILTAQITHRDPRAVAGAVGVAAAIAYSLTHRSVILGEWLDHVGCAMRPIAPAFAALLERFPGLLSKSEESAVQEISTLGYDDPDLAPPDRVTPFVVPSVMTAFYWFLRHPDEWVRTVGGCLRSGGDVATIASIGGGLSGASNGVEAIPAPLREALVDRDRIVRTADRLHTAKEAQRAKRRRA